MANSRKSRRPNSSGRDGDLQSVFERALGDILARVCVSAPAKSLSQEPLPQPLRIAIAYSGGLDSSVLLHLAAQYAAARDISLFAFHIHHGLSPHADAWLAHCEAEAWRSKVP